MNQNLAPIVLFVYNRPWHTRQTLEALSKNNLADRSILYVFADGAKENATKEERQSIDEVRKIIKEKLWCREVNLIEREKNLGLADNIVGGVTEIINEFGKIIVLEDDIVTSSGFLKFMNDALSFYENEDKVMHISGYMFPVRNKLDDLLFLKQTHCWGWATWERAWMIYNDDAIKLHQSLKEKNRVYEFNLYGCVDFLKQLEENCKGSLKTWAVKWYASVFLADGFALHPGISLVNNVGFDSSGENCSTTSKYHNKQLAEGIIVDKIPVKISEDSILALSLFFRQNQIYSVRMQPVFAILIKISNLYKKIKIKYKKYILKKSKGIFIDQSLRITNTTLLENRFGGYISIGSHTELLDGVCVFSYGGFVQIGKHCSINPYTIIYGHGGVVIGDNVLIAGHCMIIPNNHIYVDKNKPIATQGGIKKGIIIEDDVWIGHGCSILDGVIIGRGSIIAAGSVVKSNIPPFSIVAGVPAKVIKQRN